MAKLEFRAPQAAPAQLSLRKEASSAGLSEEALRDLLWLINAHPKLIAHAQIFHNVGRMLSSEVFSPESLSGWAGDWRSKTCDWLKLCSWVWTHCESLSRLPGLKELHYRTSGKGASAMLTKHPIVNEGAQRHAVPAAMWNIHETDSEALDGGDPPDAAKKYLILQAHVLAAYFECRSRTSDVAFYESYSGEQERPIAPVRTERISPGVRELSLADYESLLLQLPNTPSTPAFAEALQGQSVSFEQIQDLDTRRRARSYILGLRRYFGRYLKMLGGWKPPQSLRRGWGGGGGRDKRHGYLRCLSAPGVYLSMESASSDDPEVAHLVGQQVYIDWDSETDDDPDALEATGLAPGETLGHVFGLFSPDELGGRYLEKQRQRQAMVMRNQCLPFAYEALTPQEVQDIWHLADKHITRYLDAAPTSDALRQAAVAGIILKLSLAFGLRVESLAKLRLSWIASDSESPADTENKAEASVLIVGTALGDWSTARIVGIRMPGIMPSYKTVLADELEEVDGEYADNFVLPIAHSITHISKLAELSGVTQAGGEVGDAL